MGGTGKIGSLLPNLAATTYLTVPEWYVVYSTEEYASFLREHPPSRFPYLGASRQYWEYYGAMCEATRGVHPVDPGVHLMLGVIGVSFTAENTVKAVWEFASMNSAMRPAPDWVRVKKVEAVLVLLPASVRRN